MNKLKETFFKSYLFQILFLSLFTLFFSIVGYIYIQRLGAFGCSDQCPVFTAAYFMIKGKSLYMQVFFNHQMIMPYVSFLLQLFFHPDSIYKLVLYHQLFILLFAFFMDAIIIARFGWKGLVFAFYYESTKFYLHGNLFLAESIIVYPLVYLVGISIMSLEKKSISKIEGLFCVFLTWLVVFLREPYIPLVLFVFLIILIHFSKRNAIIFVSFFLILSGGLLVFIDLKNYIFDVILLNIQAAKSVQNSSNIIKSFLYPVIILIEGKKTFLREILIFVDSVFVFVLFTIFHKKKKVAVSIFFILGLAVIRYVTPGIMYFEAFHLLPWYALFIFVTFYLLDMFLKQKKRYLIYLGFGLYFFILFIYIVFSRKSFMQDKINKQEEFTTNFASYFVYGDVIKILASKKNTVFLDLWDDLIYWQSGLDSSYRYSLFIPVMKTVPEFENSRNEMFKNSPPDFYYLGCRQKVEYLLIPKTIRDLYLPLLKNGNKSCLLVKKTILKGIRNDQKQKISQLGFSIPVGS